MDRWRRAATNPWVCAVALAATAGVSLWSVARVPEASAVPALLGLAAFAVGKYVLCPLRWHALSVGGQNRWWHVRAYAEGELVGLAAPVHAAADLWRAHRLRRVGLAGAVAYAEVGLDRLVGMAGIGLGVVCTGIALPAHLLAVFAAVGLAVAVLVVILRWRRPDLLRRRPLPAPRVVALGLVLSLGYQAGIAALVLGAVTAVGATVEPLAFLAVFGASQLASVLPGLDGANPRSGAIAVGLASLGVTWTAALGAVALVALLPWIPALLLGGGSFAGQRAAMTWRNRSRSLPMTPVAPSRRASSTAPAVSTGHTSTCSTDVRSSATISGVNSR